MPATSEPVPGLEDHFSILESVGALRQHGVVGQVGSPKHLLERALEDLVVAAVDVERLVLGHEYARGARVGTGVAVALRLVAGGQVLHGAEPGHQDGGVEQCHFHLLALAVAGAGHQREEDGVGGAHRGGDVHDRRAAARALPVGVAVHRDEAALGSRNRIEPETVRKGAFAPRG